MCRHGQNTGPDASLGLEPSISHLVTGALVGRANSSSGVFPLGY